MARLRQNLHFTSRQVGTALLGVMIMAGAALMQMSTVYGIDPPTSPPRLVLDTISSELRSKVVFTVRAEDGRMLDGITMEIKDQAGVSLANPVRIETSGPVDHASLTWDTRTVADGSYSLQYSARAGEWQGDEQEGSFSFQVLNGVPLVTINPSTAGRVLTGLVSRADVTFRILVDGTLLEVVPKIAPENSETGMSEWSVELPASVKDGQHEVNMFAKVVGGEGSGSTGAMRVITVTTPTPPQTESPVVPVVTLPPLELAEEMGVFVAPVIATLPQPQLYGAAVADLVDKKPVYRDALAVAAPISEKELPLQVAASDDPRVAPVVQATHTGWHLFGVAWYWWLLTAVAAPAIMMLTARHLQRQRASVTDSLSGLS